MTQPLSEFQIKKLIEQNHLLKTQIDKLAAFLLNNYSRCIGDEGAIDMAIRLLEKQ